MAITAVMAGAKILGGIGTAIIGGAARRRARRRRRALEGRLDQLEQNRQDIINPYANISDLSGQLSNPFANLQVATEAAEMQAQQTDISLATSLDTLRATGAGAGGATALAQAALSSKQGIAASIAQQEAQNAQLRAQGEQQLQRDRIREQQRIQQAEAAGKQFVFSAREDREMQELNRLSSLLSGASQQEAAYTSATIGGVGKALGGIGSFAMAGGFGSGNNSNASSGGSNINFEALGSGYTDSTFNPDITVGGMLDSYYYSSDRRLKKNIKLIGYSPKGLKIYAFEYIDRALGKGVYQGVMSDEISKNAVIKDINGFDKVDYSKLDVEFKLIK